MSALGAVALALSALAVFVGATDHGAGAVVDALLGGGGEDTRLVVLDVRLPRAVAALLVGGALGGAGAVMQVITRNPIAGPGIMGLNGGGSLAVLVIMVTLPGAGLGVLALGSLAGSAVAASLVIVIARSLRAGMTPLGLTLVGAAVAALLGAVSGAIVIASNMQNDMLYWTVGGLGTLDWPAVGLLAAGTLPVGALTLGLTPALTGLLLGDDSAAALGLRIARVRVLSIGAVVVAAGLSTAIAGPVAFVGLMAPHAARAIFGHDQRWVVPAAAIVGGAAVQAADVIGRWVIAPGEIPMGVFLGLCGAPLMVWLVAGRRVAVLA